MYGFLLAVLVIDGIFMSIVVLLQAGKGGGLASVGGGAGMTEGVLGGRQATTVLTRATWISGSVFMVLALVLSIMSSRSALPESVIQVPATAPTSAPQPVLPGLGGGEGGAAAPAPAPVGTASPAGAPGN
ncbi:MAG: preprotein translocase subunit SecG [Gemmatimonadetes bacterium]|nr:preprotein translocase subunit SecG [Gemmatimonadota bacterium]